ncbi:MAG: hypothetical protein HYS25_09565 [Ignavibacteriales bacterium]|nr:hypothetical protein [Ignavibacteriales bacterium]
MGILKLAAYVCPKDLKLYEENLISRKTLRLAFWIKAAAKIYLIIIGLYLIVKASEVIASLIIR